MSVFEHLDRADNWLHAVVRAVNGRVAAVGPDRWNHDPANRETRERALRLLVRAVNRRENERERLVTSGLLPDDGIARARLRERAQVRDRAERVSRVPSLPGRASR